MSAATDKDIENIVELLDSMVASGTDRIKVKTSETQAAETVTKSRRYGRCDMRPGREGGNLTDCE